MKYIIFFFVYAIGNIINLQIIGTLTLTDLLIFILFIIQLIRGKVYKTICSERAFQYITKLYITLFFIQFFTEILVNNEINNMLKGLAVTVFSFIKIPILWSIIIKEKNNILWLFLFTCIVNFLAIDNEDAVTAADVMSGESFSFFKFKIAPLIGEALVILTLIRKRSYDFILFIIAGIFCIVLGARSTGLMIFLTGATAFFFINNKKIEKKVLIKWSIIGSIVCYGLFVVYVNAVLSGDIIGGNSSFQIRNARNPYNPLYVLLSGRTESPASIAAIADSPIIGWGAWAEDPNLKYHIIQMQFQDEKLDPSWGEVNIIPAHSVVLQTGVNNGIFAMIVIFMIIYFFIKKGAISLNKNNPYLYLVLYCIFQLIWNGLFSPLNHFRASFPIYFICCFYSYKFMRYQLKKQKEKKLQKQ